MSPSGDDAFARMVQLSNRAFARRREMHRQKVRLSGLEDRPDIGPVDSLLPGGLMRSVFDALPEAILVGDEEGNFIDGNNAAVDLVGHSRARIRRLNVLDVIAATQTWTIAEFGRFRRQGSWRGDLEIRHSSARVIAAEALASFVEAPGGSAFIAVVHRQVRGAPDGISDRLDTGWRELQSGVASSEALARVILREGGLPEHRLEALAHDFSGLDSEVEAIADAALLAQGRTALSRTLVDLGEILARTADALSIAHARSRLSLLVPRGEMLGFWDGARIQQVAQFLLLNALRRSPRGSRVRVVAGDYGREVCVSITDEGPVNPMLIPAVDAEDPAALPARSMYTARMLVEAHGGRIWAEPESDSRGLTVSFTLPHHQAEVLNPGLHPWTAY